GMGGPRPALPRRPLLLAGTHRTAPLRRERRTRGERVSPHGDRARDRQVEKSFPPASGLQRGATPRAASPEPEVGSPTTMRFAIFLWLLAWASRHQSASQETGRRRCGVVSTAVANQRLL